MSLSQDTRRIECGRVRGALRRGDSAAQAFGNQMVSDGLRSRSRVQTPERSGQSGVVKDRVRLVDRRTAPVRREPIVEPQLPEPPQRVDAEDRTHRDSRLRAPPRHVLFRPEESHGASRERDVRPPASGRHGEMSNGIGRVRR